MFCQQCGAELAQGAAYCAKCGAKVMQEGPQQQMPPTSQTGDGMQKSVNGNNPFAGNPYGQPNQFTGNGTIPNGRCYGDNIKPYYREEFDRIASGQKPRFNWVAFFLAPYTQLYNGCTKIFCKTFLLTMCAVFIIAMMSTLGGLRFNLTLVFISSILMGVCALVQLVLQIMNGMHFNKWFYQDVMENPNKKRTKKGLWIFIACQIVAIALLEMIAVIFRPSLDDIFDDDLQDDFYFESDNAFETDNGFENDHKFATDDINSGDNVLDNNLYSGEILYEGIPLSTLISLPANDIIAGLGTPDIYDEYKLAYDDIEFDLNGGRITRTESYSLDKYTVNGENLEKNRTGLVGLLGEPSDEEYTGGGYSMTWQFPVYSVFLELGDADSEAWRICVSPIDNGQLSYSPDGIQNNNYQPSDGLSSFSENSLYLFSGSYIKGDGSSISVSIYSSFDEGNTVGNITFSDSLGHETFATIRDDNAGEGIYTLCFDDGKVMYILFYQDSTRIYCADIEGLDAMYINANRIETYIMTEQYVS